MRIGERLISLSLRDAEATTEKDKTMISDLVQKSRGSFDEIDLVPWFRFGYFFFFFLKTC